MLRHICLIIISTVVEINYVESSKPADGNVIIGEPCKQNICQNGAECIVQNGNVWCNCPLGYQGSWCEQAIDECYSMPCKNGAICEDEINGYRCQCREGYGGVNCERETNECRSSPCMNGGTCFDQFNGYTCVCTKKYMGQNCEIILSGKKNFCKRRQDGNYRNPESCSSFIQCSGGRLTVQKCPGKLAYDVHSDTCDYPSKIRDCHLESNFCYRRRDGNYRNPKDCTQFYQCSGGEDYIQYCQKGLVYNQNYDKCDYPYNVPECEFVGKNDGRFCDDRPDGNYRHPNDCKKFFTCSSHIRYIFKCPVGLVYNRDKGVCDWQSNVPECSCNRCGFCTKTSTDTYPHASDCKQFLQCSNGILITRSCPSGLVYVASKHRCDYPPSTGACSSIIGNGFCHGKFNGLYSDPDNYSRFYQCSNGVPYHYSCPSGLVYNEPTKRCEYPQYVPGCDIPTDVHNPFCDYKQDGLYRDPSDCNKFFKCFGHLTYHLSCAEGLAFDKKRLACRNSRHVAECAEPEANMCARREDAVTRDPNSCSRFFICKDGMQFSRKCYSGYAYSSETGKCEPRSQVPGCNEQDETCTGKPDGNYPHPRDCTKFIFCSSGFGYSRSCGEGMTYNSRTKRCEP
ncbi:neurogenic locus notch homolog protein 1-like [Anneissia japonica]|uniref:neurogenic locus notch homolog protein 1-like n=1 Tax=Anneissia japonica TaxID=1529436 RepID=UPI001425B7A5|nr:neurogenic locus notch homolog protein 1-like [Anneissia japonica]